MTSMVEHLRQAADDYAAHAQQRITQLDARLAEIEKEKDKIEAERAAARGALQRAADYPMTDGINYLCPICWVDGKRSLLRGVASTTRDDIVRCGACSYEDVIPSR